MTSVSETIIRVKENSSEEERNNRSNLVDLMKRTPIPDSEILMNLSLYLTRQNLSHILFMQELYKMALGVHGIIMEFGVRWGRNLALYESFRGIHEPFNHNRRIIGFDTFDGFPAVDDKDGAEEIIHAGSYKVTEAYPAMLAEILDSHELESPISHIKKYELIQGNASKTLPTWLARYPETIISLAYFDFDLYEPTLDCLKAIKPHLTRGSVIGFDELNNRIFPGETRALAEVIGLDTWAIRHNMYSPTQSYIIIG